MARSETRQFSCRGRSRRLEIQQDRRAPLLLVAAFTLVTIGFWGGVMALDKSRDWLAALIMLGAGTILLCYAGDFGIRRL